MSKVTWIPDARVRWLGAVVPAAWFDSGCGAGPRARWLPDGSIEIEGEGVPVKALPKDVAQWSGEIAKAANKHGVPPQFVAGIMATESGGQPGLSSYAGAGGLMGLMPATASELAGRTVAPGELLSNTTLNVDLGTKLIARLLTKYQGNPIKVALAYNAGGVKCGAPKRCPNAPNRWNAVTDCDGPNGVGGKAVDYPGRMIGYSNAAVKAGIGTKMPGVSSAAGWSTWQLALGAVSLAVIGLAVFKPGVLRGAAGMLRSNPVDQVDKSTHSTVIEYAVREMFKRKGPRAAAEKTAKSLSGSENLFLGSGVVVIDPRVLEEALWERMITQTLHAQERMKPGVPLDFIVGGTAQHFNQGKATEKELLRRLRERGVKSNPDENLIRRAASILQYASPEEAAEILVESEDLSQEDAHLAVRAGELLLKDREGRSSW